MADLAARAAPPAVMPDLPRKVFAELLGSLLLTATVVGSGIAASRRSPDDAGLRLLESALVTGAVLVALILALGPVSAAFNPAVTLAERAFGALTTRTAALLITAQLAGCCIGALLANVMFSLPVAELSRTDRSGGGQWLGEVVATFGLVVVVFGVLRSGRPGAVAYAVAGWITAAYFFTSSTSFANPAITVGRMLSDTFAGIAPSSAPGFVLMQLVGAGLAVGAVGLLYPDPGRLARQLTTGRADR